MLGKLLLLSGLTRLAASTPVPPEQKTIKVEKPKNFYIEPDLDVTRPYTEEAKFSVVKYGSVRSTRGQDMQFADRVQQTL
jgi:hypothetical protein